MTGRYRDRQPDLIDDIKALTQRIAKLESASRIAYTAVDSTGLRIVNGNLEIANSSGDLPIQIGKVSGAERFSVRYNNDDGTIGAEIGDLPDNETGVLINRDGVVIKALNLPGIIVLFDHVPAINESDLMQVIQTHETDGQLMTMWMNERGNLRLEQQRGSRFDNLYLAIMDGAADPGASGWPFSVERRDSGVRTRIGGLNWYGQYATDLFSWANVTAVDPNTTGHYTTSGVESGSAPLQVRLETSEIVRVQGRVVATNMAADETIMVIPNGYQPLSLRNLRVGVDDGSVITCRFLVNGDVITKAAISGTVELSFDDITYSRVFTQQPTGGWTIEDAVIATPDTTSPLTLVHSSEADTAYVLFVSRDAANDDVTGVTDDGSNTWTEQADAGGGGTGRRIQVWTLIPGSAFTEVYVAFTGSSAAYASMYKVTGYDPADLVDVASAVTRSSSTTPAALEVTASQAGNIAIAAVHANPNTIGSITPSAGWTDLTTNNGGPDVVYMVDPPLSANGVSWTFSTSAGSGHAIIVLNIAP